MKEYKEVQEIVPAFKGLTEYVREQAPHMSGD